MSESAWKFGAYRKGMGDDGADPREAYACMAIKRELTSLGYGGINLTSAFYGYNTDKAVRRLQRIEGLHIDGMVGRATANALWRARIVSEQIVYQIPGDWLRAHCHWESGDDPGAELVNTDGSRDRGLFQNNDVHEGDPLTDDEAFDPAVSTPRRAKGIADWAAAHPKATCRIDDSGTVRTYDRYALGVGAHRSPVGAQDLANDPGVVEPKRRQDGGTWEQAVAFYILRVDHEGRQGWVG